ncbi:MAG: putative phosphatase regulatory subunit-domain-containing protein [Benjaminiella poitrasii]|nr:MAG: putative phosphatase regulatory subunit-domain-containing protein [Benjaminiella poitrasii]
MTSTLSSQSYMNHLHNPYNNNNNRKRIVLKRSTVQINDPIVVQQKYNYTTATTTLSKPKKSVRFHEEELEQVRYFYKSQSPDTVKEDPPMMCTLVDDYKLTQPNWPPSRNNIFYNSDQKIRMETVQLANGDYEQMADNMHVIQGRCRALNISFHKVVSIRYTFDLWRTYEETIGTFRESIASTSNTWDRFDFSIPFEAKDKPQTVYLALRYTVDSQDFWDNNNGMNYEILITPNLETMSSTTEKQQYNNVINKDGSLVLVDEQQQENDTINSKQKKDNIKVLGKRYDFTASLSAARKSFSPPPSPPGTPDDNEMIFNYTPPVFFSSTTTTIQLDTITTTTSSYQSYSQKSTAEPIPIAMNTTPSKKKPLSATTPVSSEGFQMNYSDFINKYCFYSSHSNPMYNVYSTSPSAVLS